MRGVAEAFAAAGYHVELPRLPGHGTAIDDMLTTALGATGRPRSRRPTSASPSAADRIVVVGLSRWAAR